jgi:hypothetical protein
MTVMALHVPNERLGLLMASALFAVIGAALIALACEGTRATHIDGVIGLLQFMTLELCQPTTPSRCGSCPDRSCLRTST